MFGEEIIIQTDGMGNKIEKYIRKQKIGSGGFAKCYVLIKHRTQQKFAAKVISSRELKQKSARSKIMQQIEIHKKLDHPHIVKFYDTFQFEDQIYMVMELCQNNTLKEFIKSRVRITEFEAKCYLYQIIEGIQYLHSHNIIHRDIKLGNLFLNLKMEVKIGDFGLSKQLKQPKQKRFTTCGTPNYIAPEILKQSGHSFQADIWAIGIILYAMLIGKPPFQSQSVENTYKKIKNNIYEFPKQIPLSHQAKNLIKRILDPNPKTRITLQEIKKHEFLNKDSQKIPKCMPPYTISIPPQINFLKQYVNEKNMKLLIYPKKIVDKNNLMDDNEKVGKLNRVLSADKNLLARFQNLKHEGKSISSLNRGRYIKTIRTLSLQKFSINHSEKNKEQNAFGSSISNKLPSPSTLKQKVKVSPETQKNREDLNQVICYYDISQKYGIGYLLSNGSYGIVFNDRTSITAVPKPVQDKDLQFNFYYFEKSLQIFSIIPDFLSKKKEILKYCEQKLESYRKNNVLIPYYSETFVKKWIKIQSGFAIKLSNGIIQFFWGADSITLRNYKWIRWRINQEEGQGKLNQRIFPDLVKQKIQKVRDFLLKNCVNSKTKFQNKQ